MTKPTPAEIDTRWGHAIELAKLHGIECTGGLDPERDCTEPGALPILVFGRLFAICCRRHAAPLIEAIAKRGIGAVTAYPLVELVALDHFTATAANIRERNIRHGVILPSPD